MCEIGGPAEAAENTRCGDGREVHSTQIERERCGAHGHAGLLYTENAQRGAARRELRRRVPACSDVTTIGGAGISGAITRTTAFSVSPVVLCLLSQTLHSFALYLRIALVHRVRMCRRFESIICENHDVSAYMVFYDPSLGSHIFRPCSCTVLSSCQDSGGTRSRSHEAETSAPASKSTASVRIRHCPRCAFSNDLNARITSSYLRT